MVWLDGDGDDDGEGDDDDDDDDDDKTLSKACGRTLIAESTPFVCMRQTPHTQW